MKRILTPAMLVFLSVASFGSVVNKGAQIVVKANSFVNLTSGDFVNKSSGSSHGAVTLDGTIKLGGDWTNSATSGTVFEPESAGTVVFSGTAQTIAGATSFPNLTKSVSSADTLTFSSGAANRTSITGAITLQGASGQLLSLRSSNSGTQWELDPQGTRTLEYLDVKDSKNVNASVIDVHGENCSDSGNNTNWLFTQETTYTVTFTAGANGTLSGQTTQTVVSGDDCSAVTAVPANGYHFVNWTGSSTSTSNPLTVTNVTSNMNFTANFEANPVGQYTVTFVAGNGGSITGTASQTVEEGANCSPVTAVPSSGYNFSGWTGSHTGSENPLTITNVQQNMTITANFALKTYTVSFSAGANGTITGTATQTVSHGGSSTAVTAVPDSSYMFVNWTGSATSTQNPLTVTNVTADMNFTANFATASYTVTFTAGNGGSLTGTTTQTVAHGGNCTAVTAVPDSGYSFAGWAGDYGGNENPLTVSNVIANMSINANFAQITYNVVFTAGANGSISGTANQTVAKGGSSSPVTAVPADGYHFAGWTGDHVGTENPLTVINVQANKAITANFEQNAADQFTVTFVAGSGGTISGSASQTVSSGGDCTAVTAVPNAGNSFIDWTGDHAGTENPLTITGVVADMTINANFAAQTFTVVFTAGAGGTLAGDTEQTVSYGDDCTAVTATPDNGYYFSGWSGDHAGKTNPLTITDVSANMAITANFAQKPAGQFVLSFTAGANGAISGESSQLVVSGGNGSPVTAVPADGYRFQNWTGSATSADNPFAVSNVISDMNFTANFAANPPGFFTVTFVPGENGSISGENSQLVADGGDCTAVTAMPIGGYSFIDWSGSYSGTTNPLVIQDVSENMVVTANFAIPSNQFACGKFYQIEPSEIDGYEGDRFVKAPALKAIYDDPFNVKKTNQKASMKVLNKIGAKSPAYMADAEWTKKIKLYDPKKWNKAKTCEQNLEANPISPLLCDEVLVTVTDMEKNKLVDIEIGQATLRPPYINKVTNSYGADITSAGAAETIYIEGTFFGKDAPKVWLEYPVYEKDGETVKQIKGLAMKIQKPYIYPNYKEEPGKSCMDIETGVSRIAVSLPAKFPKGWKNADAHNIVIDNKIGRATWEFGTK